jgi:hypothetical protein
MITEANQNDIANHVIAIFGQIPSEGWINVRGIGEKGTDKEGVFRDDKFIDLSEGAQPDHAIGEIARHVSRWNEHGIGSFIVPAILSAARGTAENVHAFHSLVVDLDSGDIQAKADYLYNELGAPTCTIMSGGKVDGQAKRHLWWSLTEPCTDVARIVQLRHLIAAKAGGDLQFGMGVASNPFGRAHQPVRIAGSIHNKNNKASPVMITLSDTWHDLGSIEARAVAMANAFGSTEIKTELEIPKATQTSAPIVLTEKIHEGGMDKTRFSEFSRIAGHYIRAARRGEMTLDKAKELLEGWVMASMVPPWPKQRVDSEWGALLKKDLLENGTIKTPEKVSDLSLVDWRVDRWAPAGGDCPKRQFLVDKLVLNSKPQLIVAEGGAGKSYLMLDLALKVAAWDKYSTYKWLGHEVLTGGTVVYLTTEDDVDELQIRFHHLDPDNLRGKAGEKLLVIPLADAGGSFAFVEYDPQTRESRPTKRWASVCEQLSKIQDLALVMVDTLNSVLHGDENSAVVINEFLREIGKVTGKEQVPLICAHHVRKAGDEPTRTAEEMRESIRGSSALINGFRAAIGIWHCPDQDRRLAAMDLPIKKKSLWKAAVVKLNNPEMLDGDLTLHRNSFGLLEDVTDRDVYAHDNLDELHAWLLLAIETAAQKGHPFSNGQKNSKSGFYSRRNELPRVFMSTGPGEFQRLIDDLLRTKHIVACAARGSRDKKWMDLPTGTYARDAAGAELNAGAFDPPNWNLWRYDSDLKICTTTPE